MSAALVLPWIKLYARLPRHRKSVILCDVLGRVRAWTHVVELWMWASENAPTGDLSGLTDRQIARCAGWNGKADTFVAGLRAAGFLDDSNKLHGWEEHQAAHVANAAANDDAARAPTSERAKRDAAYYEAHKEQIRAKRRQQRGTTDTATDSDGTRVVTNDGPTTNNDGTQRTATDTATESAPYKKEKEIKNETEKRGENAPPPVTDARPALQAVTGGGVQGTETPRHSTAGRVEQAKPEQPKLVGGTPENPNRTQTLPEPMAVCWDAYWQAYNKLLGLDPNPKFQDRSHLQAALEESNAPMLRKALLAMQWNDYHMGRVPRWPGLHLDLKQFRDVGLIRKLAAEYDANANKPVAPAFAPAVQTPKPTRKAYSDDIWDNEPVGEKTWEGAAP